MGIRKIAELITQKARSNNENQEERLLAEISSQKIAFFIKISLRRQSKEGSEANDFDFIYFLSLFPLLFSFVFCLINFFLIFRFVFRFGFYFLISLLHYLTILRSLSVLPSKVQTLLLLIRSLCSDNINREIDMCE
jgi:hypothetical protein